MEQLNNNDNCILCGEVPRETGCNANKSSSVDFSTEAEEQTYERGQIIFEEGSESTSSYAIKSGRVKLYRTDKHGNRQAINLLGAGDLIGFRTLLANQSHTVTAEAIESTRVCKVTRKRVLDMFGISNDLAQDLMSKLAAELLVSEETMISLLHHSVKQRTARLLLSLVNVNNGFPNAPLKVTKLRRTEMAQLIGTTPESLSRTLATFSEKGLIETTRVSINILNQAGLSEVIDQKE